jgi:hypothetical protein
MPNVRIAALISQAEYHLCADGFEREPIGDGNLRCRMILLSRRRRSHRASRYRRRHSARSPKPRPAARPRRRQNPNLRRRNSEVPRDQNRPATATGRTRESRRIFEAPSFRGAPLSANPESRGIARCLDSGSAPKRAHPGMTANAKKPRDAARLLHSNRDAADQRVTTTAVPTETRW